MEYNLFQSIRRITESSIDYPMSDLDLNVWQKIGKEYKLKDDVKKKILSFISTYPSHDLRKEAEKISIVGSIGSNQYRQDTDIDVHIVPRKDSELWDNKEVQKDVKDWSRNTEVHIFKHPIEIYIQSDPEQDKASIANYDIISDRWIIGPNIVSQDYDPYEDFKDLFDEIRDLSGESDLKIGELKRDVIDFKIMQQAFKNMSGETRVVLLKQISNKLKELEGTINDLYSDRKEWIDLRHSASPTDAKSDAEDVRNWRDANAIFKFMDRYKYLKIIDELHKLVRDDGLLSHDEIDKITGILKGN